MKASTVADASSASPIRRITLDPVPQRFVRARGDAIAWLAALAPAVCLYTAFVARSAFRVNGVLYFSLFDDAMVSMRFARNLAHGHGLVWNAGQHPVEGYTNLLWTLWMAVLHLLPVGQAKLSLAVMATGAALLLANAVLAGRIATELGASRRAALLATALVSLIYPLVFWTLRGMEVGPAAIVLSAAVLVALRFGSNRDPRSASTLAILLFLGPLVRLDLAIPLAVVATYALAVSPRARRMRLVLLLGGALAVSLAGQTVFRLAYYGLPLPNTYYLKVSGIALTTRVGRGLSTLIYPELTGLFVPLVLAAIYLISRRREKPRQALLLGAVFASVCAYSVLVGGDAWEWMRYSNRFIAPAVPLLAILCVVAIDALLGQGAHARRRLQLALAASLVFLQLSGIGFVGWSLYNATYRDEDALMTRYAIELRAATTPDASIAVVWAGAVPYFSERRSIDLLGKSDHHVATRRSRGPFLPGHTKWDYDYSIGAMKPDVVVGLWRPTPSVLRKLKAWGYTRLTDEPLGGVFVRASTSRVDRAELEPRLQPRRGGRARLSRLAHRLPGLTDRAGASSRTTPDAVGATL